MNTPKGDNESAPETPSKPGFHFAIPAALPGLLGAGFIAVQGMSVSAAAGMSAGLGAVMAAAGPALTVVAPAIGGSGLAGGAVAGLIAGIAAIVGGAAGASFAGVGGIVAAAVVGAGAGVAAAASAVFSAKKLPYTTQYSLTKQLAGIFAGAAIGGAAMYGAAVNAPEAQEPAEKPAPVSTLHMEQRGGSLSRDFTLAENTVATATVENGRTVYKLTAPKATY